MCLNFSQFPNLSFWSVCVCVYAYMCVNMCTHTYICLYTCIHTCINIYTVCQSLKTGNRKLSNTNIYHLFYLLCVLLSLMYLLASVSVFLYSQSPYTYSLQHEHPALFSHLMLHVSSSQTSVFIRFSQRSS